MKPIALESLIHLNTERSVNQTFPPAECILKSAIYALTQGFLVFLISLKNLPCSLFLDLFSSFVSTLILFKKQNKKNPPKQN